MAFSVNMRHYLGEDLSLIDMPVPAATLRDFLASVVKTVTSKELHNTDHSIDLLCRKRCDTNIAAYYDPLDSSIIEWFCCECKDLGRISGWEETLWDRRPDK